MQDKSYTYPKCGVWQNNSREGQLRKWEKGVFRGLRTCCVLLGGPQCLLLILDLSVTHILHWSFKALDRCGCMHKGNGASTSRRMVGALMLCGRTSTTLATRKPEGRVGLLAPLVEHGTRRSPLINNLTWAFSRMGDLNNCLLSSLFSLTFYPKRGPQFLETRWLICAQTCSGSFGSGSAIVVAAHGPLWRWEEATVLSASPVDFWPQTGLVSASRPLSPVWFAFAAHSRRLGIPNSPLPGSRRSRAGQEVPMGARKF